MHTTATLHVHPACSSNRKLIEQLELNTNCQVIIHHGKPRLVTNRARLTPFDPNDGGRAA